MAIFQNSISYWKNSLESDKSTKIGLRYDGPVYYPRVLG